MVGGVSPKLFLNMLERTDSPLALPCVKSVYGRGRFLLTREVQFANQRCGLWARDNQINDLNGLFEVSGLPGLPGLPGVSGRPGLPTVYEEQMPSNFEKQPQVFSLGKYHLQRFGAPKSKFDQICTPGLIKVFAGLSVQKRARCTPASTG